MPYIFISRIQKMCQSKIAQNINITKIFINFKNKLSVKMYEKTTT